jgi:hypothetical protein
MSPFQNNDNTKDFEKGINNMCLKWEGHKGPKGASHSLSPSLILD